jgi:hypothetical protein
MAGTFSDSEKTNLLFKKLMGKSSCVDSRDFFQETINSRSQIYQSQLLSSTIPDTAPTDLQALTSSSLDDLGQSINGSTTGKTSSTTTYITRYFNVTMTPVSGASGVSYSCPQLKNSIPFNYDSSGSYLVNVYKSTGTEIPAGTSGGSWVVDPDAGVVSFYAYENISGVTESLPPKISFYRYTGSFGAITATAASDLVASTETTFTVPQTFDGGALTGTGDSLAAIVVDDRNYSTLAVGDFAQSIQIGGDYDLSWRFLIQKTDSTNSAFLLQARTGGSWITKGEFNSSL